MTLVDGAQALGCLKLNLHDLGCMFYTASTHKWLMGPFENGVLYVNKDSRGEVNHVLLCCVNTNSLHKGIIFTMKTIGVENFLHSIPSLLI
jgi:selenocysteine lyase/cysteine desulfurase